MRSREQSRRRPGNKVIPIVHILRECINQAKYEAYAYDKSKHTHRIIIAPRALWGWVSSGAHFTFTYYALLISQYSDGGAVSMAIVNCVCGVSL